MPQDGASRILGLNGQLFLEMWFFFFASLKQGNKNVSSSSFPYLCMKTKLKKTSYSFIQNMTIKINLPLVVSTRFFKFVCFFFFTVMWTFSFLLVIFQISGLIFLLSFSLLFSSLHLHSVISASQYIKGFHHS